MFGADARYFTFFLEYVAGNDLSTSAVWRTPDDMFSGVKNDAMRIWEDISGALEYLHGKSVQHNDIKPANIIYSAARGAVLCDFGLASEARPTGLLTGGTPFYVPPEFLVKEQRNPPADVWAFGVTMLYILHHIPLPDARGAVRANAKRLYWQIHQVHQRDGSTSPARIDMQAWIDEVDTVVRGLDYKDSLARILRDMLTPHPDQRVSPSELRKRIQHEIWYTKHYKRQNVDRQTESSRPTKETGGWVRDPLLGSTTEENTEENTSVEGED